MSGVFNMKPVTPGTSPVIGKDGCVPICLSWPTGWQKLLGRSAKTNNGKAKRRTLGILVAEFDAGAPELVVKYYRSTWAVVLDLDKGLDGMAIPDIVAAIRAVIPHDFAWWETFSATPDIPRLRLVFPLAAAVNGRCIMDLWERLVMLCPFPVDPSSKDRKRVHLLPPVSRQWGIVQSSGVLNPASYGWSPDKAHPDWTDGKVKAGRPGKPVTSGPVAPAAPLREEDDEEDEDSEESDGGGGGTQTFRLTGDEEIEAESDAATVKISELDRAWVEARYRAGEDRARCTCPFSTSGTYNAFVRVHDSRAFLTCSSRTHGHAAGQTWVHLLTRPAAVGAWKIPFPYLVGLDSELVKQKTSSDGKNIVYDTVSSYCPTVTALYIDHETGDEWWRIEWTGANGPKELILRRDEAAAAQRLSDRAARAGLSIHEGNRKELTVFLSAFVHANQDTMPRFRVCSRMGWFDQGFQWGRTWMDLAGSGATQELVIHGGRNGENKMADACRSSGTFADWAAAFHTLTAYPLACVGIIGSVASVLYEKIPGGMPHVMEWGAGNGTGKTASMRMAESVWAEPEAYEASWDMSQVGLEGLAGFLSHLPLFLDDTQTKQEKRNRIDPEKTVYRLVSGEGAIVGTPGGGTRQQKTWKLGAFSCGETAIAQSSQAGGMRARLVSIQEPPFGLRTKDKVSAVVAPLAQAMAKNFGWLGPACVRVIWTTDPANLERRYVRARDKWDALLRSKGHSVADRMSIHLGHLTVAAQIIEHVLATENLDGGKPKGWLMPVLSGCARALVSTDSDSGPADPSVRSMAGFWSFLVAHKGMFWSSDARDQREVYGKWDGKADWTDIYFSERCVSDFLEGEGYALSAREAIKRWTQEGLVVEKGHRGRLFNVVLNGVQTWLYRIKRTDAERLFAFSDRSEDVSADED